jgi:hypothetical protein
VIERWSTPEEIDKLRGVLLETAPSCSTRCRRSSRAAATSAPPTRSAGTSSSRTRPPGGRDAQDRDRHRPPVSFYEAPQQPALARLRVHARGDPPAEGRQGKGQGKAIPAAKVTWDKEKNTLEIENYSREPVRLNEISVVK